MAEKRMSFFDHLRELRRRLWIGFIAFLAATAVAVAFRDEVLAFIVDPLFRAWRGVPELPGEAPQLHYASPVDPLFTQLKLAVWAGLFVAAPVLIFQIWRFVAPGLYPHEKRHAYPLVIGSFVFFVGGGIFGYVIVFPIGFRFLLEYSVEIARSVAMDPTIMVNQYVDLAVGLLFAFGLVFELPLVILLLAGIGLVDHRGLLRFSRYFLVIAVAVGGILTPTPDPLNQLLMAGPLVVLYFLATLGAFLIGRRRRRAERNESGQGGVDDRQ